MGFENLIGNEKNKLILNETVKRNTILHSYLFYGNKGIGKKEFAIEFAKQILCLGDNKPCNKCKSCNQFNSDNNPDFYIIDKDGSSVKIDQIRIMQKTVIEKPINGNKKVYIINDAESMTKEAQNCLLKTLEEPQEYVVIILVSSDENQLLSTIKSRCTKIAFDKLTNDEIIRFLNGKKCDVQFNENMLELCEGSIEKAKNIVNQKEQIEQLEIIIDQLDFMNELECLNYGHFFSDNKDNIKILLDYMYVLLFQKTKTMMNNKYIYAMEQVQITKRKLDNSNNFDMCIDNMLIKIWEEFNEEHSWG